MSVAGKCLLSFLLGAIFYLLGVRALRKRAKRRKR
jgi:preprotein translocase subunit YajC